MKKLNLNDIIETSRLIIQMPKIEDAKEIFSIINWDVNEFMTWNLPKDYKEVENDIKKSIVNCEKRKSWESVIKLKDNTIIWKFWIKFYKSRIKSIHLMYYLWKKYWGNWYIPECVESFKEVIFEKFWYNRIVIRCVKENKNSIRVAEKCWFKLDWILRGQSYFKWKIVDKAFYTFLKSDYKKIKY